MIAVLYLINLCLCQKLKIWLGCNSVVWQSAYKACYFFVLNCTGGKRIKVI